MDKPICAGNPTFRHGDGPSIPTKWPHDIPGYLCQTPPFGIFSAPRFADCCSGKFYNITGTTSADDEAYPLSCAALCVVDSPASESGSDLHGTNGGLSSLNDFYHCLNGEGEDGDENEDEGDDEGDNSHSWDLVCVRNSVDGAPPHPSSSSSSTATITTGTSGASGSSTTEGSAVTTTTTHGPTTIGTILPSTITEMTSTSPSTNVPSPTTTTSAAAGGNKRLRKLQLWTGLLVVAALLTC